MLENNIIFEVVECVSRIKLSLTSRYFYIVREFDVDVKNIESFTMKYYKLNQKKVVM